jgi:hypothetical protein
MYLVYWVIGVALGGLLGLRMLTHHGVEPIDSDLSAEQIKAMVSEQISREDVKQPSDLQALHERRATYAAHHCNHLNKVSVTSPVFPGEILAYLCTDCDARLDV